MIKDRLLRFIAMENISSTQFADSIGVQRSTVSHLLAGRNNPSYDFIVKTLNHYKYLSADWLLCGIGNMYRQKDNSMNDLFSMTAAAAPSAMDHRPARPVQAAKQASEGPIQAVLPDEGPDPASGSIESDASKNNVESTEEQLLMPRMTADAAASPQGKSIRRIVIFYTDHSMDVYDA